MRYELADYEWSVIKPMLPNKPRGVPRVNDRRVLNGIFWVLRSGAPWRDLPEAFGPYTTCYNRFVRWRRAGVWSAIIDALAAAHDAAVQMIDTSIVRVHAWANTPAKKQSQQSDLLQPLSLPRPQPGRAVLQSDQTVSSGRDAIRQACRKLPRLRPACVNQAMVAR
jgi:transposase